MTILFQAKRFDHAGNEVSVGIIPSKARWEKKLRSKDRNVSFGRQSNQRSNSKKRLPFLKGKFKTFNSYFFMNGWKISGQTLIFQPFTTQFCNFKLGIISPRPVEIGLTDLPNIGGPLDPCPSPVSASLPENECNKEVFWPGIPTAM